MVDEKPAQKKPHSPPQLYRLTAAEVVRKAIRIARAQDTGPSGPESDLIEKARALPLRSEG